MIYDEKSHIPCRKEILFNSSINIPTILNKCLDFTDADYMFCNFRYSTLLIDEDHLQMLASLDIMTYECQVNGIDICGAVGINVELLKKNNFDKVYDYIFDKEWKNRISCRSSSIKNQFSINEDILNNVILEMETCDIREHLNTSNSNVVYTFCNDVKNLPRIDIVNSNFDYICFSNVLDSDIYPWKIVDSSFNKDIIKFYPELFFIHFDISLWLEENSYVKYDLNRLASLMNEDDYVLMSDSKQFDCVYDAIGQRNDIESKKFKVSLILDKYPIKMGMIDSYFILRRHNIEECQNMMNSWHNYKICYDVDDDICFNYAFWKMKGKYLSIPFPIANQRFIRK